MRVVFHHEPFDADVSSGSIHAAYQWVELFLALGVECAAVINTCDSPWPQVSSDFCVEEFSSLADFLASRPNESVGYVSPQGDTDFRSFDYSSVDWLLFGGVSGTPVNDILIPTAGGRELYPREAAAIVLAEVAWPSR